MINNGWISAYDDEKPESGEEVLTLSYAGDFPAPAELFELSASRAYEICTYFYPGDQSWNEVAGDPQKGIPSSEVDVTFEEEGFYLFSPSGRNGAFEWYRVHDIKEGNSRGIVCWKRLDYPSIY